MLKIDKKFIKEIESKCIVLFYLFQFHDIYIYIYYL